MLSLRVGVLGLFLFFVIMSPPYGLEDIAFPCASVWLSLTKSCERKSSYSFS